MEIQFNGSCEFHKNFNNEIDIPVYTFKSLCQISLVGLLGLRDYGSSRSHVGLMANILKTWLLSK